MWKIIIEEYSNLEKEILHLEKKTALIFITSIVLLTVSWYFSNPKFFLGTLNIEINSEKLYNDLAAFSYWFVLDTILFLLVPLLIIKSIFNEDIKNYGLILGNQKIGWFFLGISILFFLPVIILVSNSETFVQFFPLMENAKNDILIFLIYEILFIGFIFSWEFIFRGFMLFGLEKRFGIYSIFIQMIPFVILHNGKPFLETFAAIFGALFLGYLALRTKSIYYGFSIHAFILVSLDIIAFLKA